MVEYITQYFKYEIIFDIFQVHLYRLSAHCVENLGDPSVDNFILNWRALYLS